MYCLRCGNSLPEDAPFCLQCGTLTRRGSGESEVSEHAPTLASTYSPSNPYSPQPATSYGPLNSEGEPQSPYASQRPYSPLVPPPPRQRRTLPGILKGLFWVILVLLLVIGGLGGLFLFKPAMLSPLVSHFARPTATPRSTVSIASQPTAILQPTATIPAIVTTPLLAGTWKQCAIETATCSFSGMMTVAFGANGSFHYATESNGTACVNAVFGDPLTGVKKACYIEAAPPTVNLWTRCAAENATCSFSGTMTVAFGAKNSYKYVTKTNGVACNMGVFGDPLYSVVKSCYLISSPTGVAMWNSCAAENSTCTFTGSHEVAYGANGKYFYKSFTNGTACNNSVFGDPTPRVGKACYYQ